MLFKHWLQRISGQKPKLPIHFLHVGKTGGTAVRHALQDCVLHRHRVVMHSHPVTLPQIPVGEKVVFFVRHPLTRFASGFVSRLRKGQPRYNIPWNRAEKLAFSRFRTPNALAEALSSEEPDTLASAEAAMRGINHVRFKLADWFVDVDYLTSRQHDLLFIGFQETLADDFTALTLALGVGDDPRYQLPDDQLNAHKSPESVDKFLDPVAVQNLERFFAADIELYEACVSLSKMLSHRLD